MARVQVVLTSYNRPRMVQDSINSVLKQAWQDFTLYIMDDNSIEEVKEILRRYSKHERVKLFFSDVKNEDRLKTCRYAIQINKALKMGTEEFVTFLCDDAGMYPNKLYDMVYFMDHHENASICYGNQELIQNGRIVACRGSLLDVKNAVCRLDHNQILFRRKILEQIGYMDESTSHIGDKDAVLFAELERRGILFHSVGKVTDWLIFHDRNFQKMLQTGRENEILKGCLME